MFTETKRRVTKVKSAVQGKWLREIIDELGISVADAAHSMGIDLPRRLHQHISDKSHIGSGFLNAFKAAYPRINLNYVLAGEQPRLLPKESADNLTDLTDDVRATYEASGRALKRLTGE
ncbi:hypothetical protein [Spirosoma flavum]|uniref:XRE family transcriptional regulator n=1 Tax=Spirosoma flavum TaxID=2048557 RepID=A0ABW6AQ31_9BACT